MDVCGTIIGMKMKKNDEKMMMNKKMIMLTIGQIITKQ